MVPSIFKMASRRAFTLIELLVVITIIVVLLALLTPAIDKALEQAELAACAARLDGWGNATSQYVLGNSRRMLTSVRIGGTAPYPSLARSVNSQGQGQWSAEAMRPYVGGPDLSDPNTPASRYVFGKVWYCPSNTAENKDVGNTGPASDRAAGWFASDYAYFGGSDVWSAQTYATKPHELVRKSLGEGRLLMADTLYLWRGGGTDTWWFNHTATGYSVHATTWGNPVQGRSSILGITGTNQLFGDGGVAWKDATRFEPKEMDNVTQKAGFVSTAGSTNPAGDLNFY